MAENDPLSKEERRQATAAMSYLAMRRVLGIVGGLLPIYLLIVGCLIEYPADSISAYYYADQPYVNGFFVGSMCAIGVFLICYRGHPLRQGDWINDDWFAHIAGGAAILVAIFPTDKGGLDVCLMCEDKVYRAIHYVSAGVFFAAVGYISFFRFPRNDTKPKRNFFYRAAGVVIAVMIIATAIAGWSERNIFWWETIAVEAFALSWFVKGLHLRGD